MPDTTTILTQEFDAEDGSFLLKLRCDMEWDRAAFTRLTNAMADCCRQTNQDETLRRRIAEGFWYATWFVPHWSRHPDFPQAHSSEYYEAAYERHWDLAFWYFSGHHPGKEGFELEPIR